MTTINNNYQKSIKIIAIIILYGITIDIISSTKKNSKSKILNVPCQIKCLFGEKGCEKGDIDKWSIVRFIVYLMIGLIVPKEYITIILLSIMIEIIQPYLGYTPKYIINPLINITGYTIGSMIASTFNDYQNKYNVLL